MPAQAPRSFPTASGIFYPDAVLPMVSSNRKRIYRGTLVHDRGARLAAVAVVFTTTDPSFYAAEVAALARNQLLCIGPEIHRLIGTVQLEGRDAPCIIEEDAGVNLEQALFMHAAIPGADDAKPAPLAHIGSPERAVENKKILHDILDQVERLHAQGLYHRDIRAANICVRRFGPDPSDIHATLIDLELVTDYPGSDIPASAERYSRSLFDRMPRLVCAEAEPIRPTSLMRDLGYLAALRFELERERDIEQARAADIAGDDHPFFSHTHDGRIVIRRLDRAEDIDPLARELGLMPLDAERFFDARIIELARQRIAPGGFLDARAREILERRAPFFLQAPIEQLAREASYASWREECLRTGRVPEYESFEDQPELLQASNRDQVRDIPAKLNALGYRIVRHSDADPEQRVTSFSTEEIEMLAILEHRRWCAERRAHGWIAGSPRDDARRIHPDIIAYDELSEQSREYDRVAARAIIGILDRAGFAVIR